MEYPTEILPKTEYAKVLDVTRLSNQVSNLIMVRRSNKPTIEETFDPETDDVKVFCVCDILEHVPNLSLNLLGAHFQSEHIRFIPKRPASNPWDGSEEIKLEDLLDHIEEKYPVCPIYFLLPSVHEMSFPCSDLEDKNALKTFLVAAGLKPASDSKPRIKMLVKHDPTRANYWHIIFTFQIIDDSDTSKEINHAKGAIREKLAQQALNFLCNYALKSMPSTKKISESLYLSTEES